MGRGDITLAIPVTIMSNVKVFVLLAGMVALFGVVGGMIGGQQGMLIALAISAVMSFVMYFNSGKMALRAYRAQVVTREQAPELYDMVDRLRQRAGLPMPQVAVAPHAQPNAFATGRNPENAVVCVTQGLMDLVGHDEAEGVIAHELGHIRNRDMLLQTLSATMAGAITNLARFGAYAPSEGRRGSPLAPLAALVAPFAAMIIQFATHPPTEERIARLQAIARGET